MTIDCSASLWVGLHDHIELCLADFTDSFMVVPTEYRRAGEIRAKSNRPYKKSFFEYFSTLPNTQPPVAHLERIISDLSIDFEKLELLKSKASISFWVVIRTYEGLDMPELFFPADVLSAISKIGALELDIY